MAQTSESASTKVAALVEKGLQAFGDRDVGKLEICLKKIDGVVRTLRWNPSDFNLERPNDQIQAQERIGDQEQEDLNVYEEYERMTQLQGTRLPELIRNCMSLEDNPQIFLLTADINLTLDYWRTIDDDKLCLHLIPEKLLSLMENPAVDWAILEQAYRYLWQPEMRHTSIRRTMLLAPGLVDILLRIGQQYLDKQEFTDKEIGIPAFLKDNLCSTNYLGRARATVIIQKVLNSVANIVSNESSSPALLVFALRCFSSVTTVRKRGDLRIMINQWIQRAVPRFTAFLHHPDHGVQAAAMRAFEDVIRSNPEVAKQVVDEGIFAKVAAVLNRAEFDEVGESALRFLWICIRTKPEDLIIEGIFQAQIPVVLTQGLLMKNNAVAVQCIELICEFIPVNLAKHLLESGTVMRWLKHIKENPYKFARCRLLKAILKYLAPTFKNDHPPSFQALTQMISETVGLNVAQRIGTVERPQDMGIYPEPEQDSEEYDLDFHYSYYDSEVDDDTDAPESD